MSTKEMLGERLLNCKIANGLFPDEATVVVSTNSGDISFFCPKEFLLNEAVRVTLLEFAQEKALVRLPVESAVGRTLVVSVADLTEVKD